MLLPFVFFVYLDLPIVALQTMHAFCDALCSPEDVNSDKQSEW